MADNDHSILIGPNGNIGKCEHYSEDHFVSHIDQEGWDNKMLSCFHEGQPEIEACANCFNYPDCVRLKLCKDDPNCYQEKRHNKLYKLGLIIQNTYRNYKDNNF